MNFVGTPQYMAPECVRNKGSFKESDIWSLGCILYQFYLGDLPFKGGSDYLIFTQSTEGIYKLAEYSSLLIPEDAKSLIKELLQVDHEKRPSIKDILTRPFFNGIKDK